MHERRIPEWLRHAPAPSVRGFALLAGAEAMARGILISVFPLAMYQALQDAAVVSKAYFGIGICSLIAGLMVPFVSRFFPRRWVYILGASFFVTGALLAIKGSPEATVLGLLLTTISTVITFVCFNAYVLDYIARIELGRCETSRMFYSALGWTIGPALGVILMSWWRPAPFIVAAVASSLMLGLFLFMRLGNGKLITKSRKPPTNPLAFLPRFWSQPRLVAGWLFAVIRSCGWWVYVVYLPIFAIENGLGDQTSGIALSISNGALFLTPLMLRWMQRRSIKRAVRTGFFVASTLFVLSALFSGLPWVSLLCLMFGSFFLILLDVSAGLPFLLAVKPSERTEMSAVYASYRDVSGIITPGVAWLILLVTPVAGLFAAGGAGLLGAWVLSGRLNPRLGQNRAGAPDIQSPKAGRA
ncbi:MFS transporter [Litoreibacter janthinus]|uniref:Major Facilitator Superfamily protein n=1 Tax=Litoreibacter janthinus TaxID=670154 RepID=A0A1I6HCX8_9RHOB|nr:MFS transporter [Litoreibacter janthinus]SFR52365.1 Major Facilitator Superfamily protein [Litoreibacter janthinus]